MKRLFLSAAILFAGITMHAQDAYNTTTTTAKNNFRWSIGVEPSVPVGHYHDLQVLESEVLSRENTSRVSWGLR
jgi:hypothetical protein